MGKVSRNFLLKIIICLTYLFVAGSAYAWEENTDRPGLNYKDFDLSAADPKLCEDACMKDPACRAWTYVKPGVQSRAARCWLKKEVPPAKTNSCCVSGVRQVRTSKTSERVLEPQTSEPVQVQETPTSQPCIGRKKLSFISASPLPSAVYGGDYTYQIQTSGGLPPISFCPYRATFPADVSPSKGCSSYAMPPGLTLSKTGLISGQVGCLNPTKPDTCGVYTSFGIRAKDSCGYEIEKEFWIDIKAKP